MVKIRKVLTTGIIGATLAIGFTGCGNSKPIPPKQMNSTKINNLNLEYKFNDNLKDTSLNKKQMMRAITSHMTNNSKYTKKTIKSRNVRKTFGQIVSYDNDIIRINYLNGNQNCGGKCKSKHGQVTQVIFDIKSKLDEKSKNSFSFIATFPTKYVIKPDSDFVGSEFDPLDKPSKLDNDAKQMFKSLQSKPITIKRSVEFKGEVNTKYPMKSVYANLKRNLKEYISDIVTKQMKKLLQIKLKIHFM